MGPTSLPRTVGLILEGSSDVAENVTYGYKLLSIYKESGRIYAYYFHLEPSFIFSRAPPTTYIYIYTRTARRNMTPILLLPFKFLEAIHHGLKAPSRPPSNPPKTESVLNKPFPRKLNCRVESGVSLTPGSWCLTPGPPLKCPESRRAKADWPAFLAGIKRVRCGQLPAPWTRPFFFLFLLLPFWGFYSELSTSS